jgi:conjugative transfer region protein TrbK
MKSAFLLRIRIGVLAFIAVLGALLEIVREDHIDVRSVRNVTDSSDSVAAELRQCQSLGDATLDDQDCAATSTETRRRFLNPALSPDPEE